MLKYLYFCIQSIKFLYLYTMEKKSRVYIVYKPDLSFMGVYREDVNVMGFFSISRFIFNKLNTSNKWEYKGYVVRRPDDSILESTRGGRQEPKPKKNPNEYDDY